MMNRTWGYVYIVRSLDRYKIGLSSNLRTLKRRLDEMNTLNAYGIEQIMLIQTRRPESVEKKLHTQFNDRRVNGEWFELTEDDLNSIQTDYRRHII